MYKTIIMPVDVFEMELSDKAVRHAEFLAQQDGVVLPPICAALKSICSMKQKRA